MDILAKGLSVQKSLEAYRELGGSFFFLYWRKKKNGQIPSYGKDCKIMVVLFASK